MEAVGAVLLVIGIFGIVVTAGMLADAVTDYRCVGCNCAVGGRVAGGTIDQPLCVKCVEGERQERRRSLDLRAARRDGLA